MAQGTMVQGAKTMTEDPLHSWNGAGDPASLESWVSTRLAAEQGDVAKVTGVTGARTEENTLRPYDDAQNELAIAGNEASLM